MVVCSPAALGNEISNFNHKQMQKNTVQIKNNEELFGEMIHEIRAFMDIHQKNHFGFSTDSLVMHLMKKFSVEKLQAPGGKTILFNGEKKTMFYSKEDFPDREALSKDLVKTNVHNTRVLISNWHILPLSNKQHRAVNIFIKLLYWLEKAFATKTIIVGNKQVQVRNDDLTEEKEDK